MLRNLYKKINKKYLSEFEKQINDDLNMPKALQILWNFLRDEKAEGKIQTLKKMDEVLGLGLLEQEKIKLPAEIKKLADERKKAREEKNFSRADELRKKMNKLGYAVEDSEEGSVVKRK